MSSTTPVESWAVDLAEVTMIHPMAGTEGILAIIAIVLWIAWHIWQCKFENKYFEEEVRRFGDAENIRRSMNE